MGSTIIRSRAPLRIGLAGGGTDVNPYRSRFGGVVLNATINRFAHANLEPLNNGMIEIVAADTGVRMTFPSKKALPQNGGLPLQVGVYNAVVRDFTKRPLSFRLTTSIDVPWGSGLGTSSTLVVAVLGAFVEWLRLPLGEYDIAKMACRIERQELKMAGGEQDQYAATFGGVNFIEFHKDTSVTVNPLRVKDEHLHELAHSLVLCYTNTSRISGELIKVQSSNVRRGKKDSIDAMHALKREAVELKRALLTGRLDEIGKIMHHGWQHKKKMASGISNAAIDKVYNTARRHGALGGKISGAGGGGFMFFYCPGTARYSVLQALKVVGIDSHPFLFTDTGLTTWTISK